MKSRAIIFTTILSAAACFGLSPRTQAVVPPPDGGYLRFNTAEDQKAPFSLTTGTGNLAVGWARSIATLKAALTPVLVLERWCST